jgi:serine protease Do
MAVVSVLGTIATFVVGTARVTDLVLDGGTGGIGPTIDEALLPPASGYEYAVVSDQTGQIRVEVPTAWGHVQGNGWHAQALDPIPEGELVGPGLNAAPNVESWRGDLRTPGVFVGASKAVLGEFDRTTILERVGFDGCTTTKSEPYTTANFTGAIKTWTCPRGAQWRVLAAVPTESRAYLVYVQVKLVSSADVAAYNRILGTFEVDFDG